MTNIWSKATKQIELWKAAGSISLSALVGTFSVTGISSSFITPLSMPVSSGTYLETGNAASLVYSASTGQAAGLLMAITYP